MLADQVGIPALRHDQALIADDRHFTLALEQLCGDFLADTLDEVEVIVGTGHTEEATVRDDWYRERRQPDLPALYDIWQRAEHALLEGFPRADVPAAFEYAVGVLVLGVVFHQWLDGDLAVCASRPVRREASGLGVVAVLPVSEEVVLAVDRVRFPARIGSVEVRLTLQHVQQDRVDLVAADLQSAVLLRLGDREGGCHAARRFQRLGELGADLFGVLAGEVLQVLQRVFLCLLADTGRHQMLGGTGQINAVADQDSRGYQQA